MKGERSKADAEKDLKTAKNKNRLRAAGATGTDHGARMNYDRTALRVCLRRIRCAERNGSESNQRSGREVVSDCASEVKRSEAEPDEVRLWNRGGSLRFFGRIENPGEPVLESRSRLTIY